MTKYKHTMTPYKDWAPTGFDSKGMGLKDQQDWLVAPVIRTRDSGPLEECNFDSFLNGLGGEGDDVEVHRFGHWGPGWIEIILVNPDSEELLKEAQEMCDSLENYPVLDEEKLSKLEHEAYVESWDSWGRSEYVSSLQRTIQNECETSPKGYPMELLGEELNSIDVDDSTFLNDAIGAVSWHYQLSGDSVDINIKGLVASTCLEKLIAELDAAVHQNQVNNDIRKLCKFCGFPADIAEKAVQHGITSLSSIRLLMKAQA